MKRRLILAALGAGALALTTVSASATPSQNTLQFQGRGPGAYSFTQDDKGGSVQFWFAEGSTHESGSVPVSYNRVVFSHINYTCDDGASWSDGTNNCRSVDQELDLFPAPSNTFSITANLSSASLPTTQATLTTSTCDIDSSYSTTCSSTSEQVPVSATFTATGPLETTPMNYRETEYCHNVYAGATHRRLAKATFTVGDKTYSTESGPTGFVNLSTGTNVSVSRC